MEFLFWDPTFLLLIPAVLLAIFAHTRVRSTYQRYSRVPNSGGYRGRDVAQSAGYGTSAVGNFTFLSGSPILDIQRRWWVV